MGFVDPQTVSNPTSGAAISAAWGDATRDAIVYCGTNKPHCNAYNATPQNVLNVTNTALALTTERYDIGSMHSTSTNTSRITAVDSGKYLLIGSVAWDNNSTNGRWVFFRADGATTLAGGNFRSAYGTSDMQTITIQQLGAGSYVELLAYQDSAATRTILVDVSVYWLGT